MERRRKRMEIRSNFSLSCQIELSPQTGIVIRYQYFTDEEIYLRGLLDAHVYIHGHSHRAMKEQRWLSNLETPTSLCSLLELRLFTAKSDYIQFITIEYLNN